MIILNKLINSVNNTMNDMNSFSKTIFTYSLLITTICFICACTFFVLARINWDNYIYYTKFSEAFMQIVQYGLGGIIISTFVDMIKKSQRPM